jgi:hypothetical protein
MVSLGQWSKRRPSPRVPASGKRFRYRESAPSWSESDGVGFAGNIPKNRSRSEPTLGTPCCDAQKALPEGAASPPNPFCHAIFPLTLPFFLIKAEKLALNGQLGAMEQEATLSEGVC